MKLYALRRKQQLGATISEVLVSAMVGTLLLSVLPAFSTGYVKLWQRETTELGAGQKTAQLVSRMKEDIRNARRVVVSPDGTAVTLVLPALSYDAANDCMVPALGADGTMVDGDGLRYYLVQNGSTGGGSVSRQVVHANGSAEAAKVVVNSVYPNLNPLLPGSSTPTPLFTYDPSSRTVSVAVTAYEPTPSGGTLRASNPLPVCRRDGAIMARTPDSRCAEGVIRCSQCGSAMASTANLAYSQTKLKVRNS